MAHDTRQRILVASLLLFNEKGVLRTSINDIADEIEISPGNLHYHFRRKADIVDSLLAEFQADARHVLEPPDAQALTLDDFWLFLHLLLELTAAYRFLIRDAESLAPEFPKTGRALRHFARALDGALLHYLRGLAANGDLELGPGLAGSLGRNLAVLALMSARYDAMVGDTRTADEESLHVARSVLVALRPFATEDAAAELEKLAAHYW